MCGFQDCDELPILGVGPAANAWDRQNKKQCQENQRPHWGVGRGKNMRSSKQEEGKARAEEVRKLPPSRLSFWLWASSHSARRSRWLHSRPPSFHLSPGWSSVGKHHHTASLLAQHPLAREFSSLHTILSPSHQVSVSHPCP